MFCTQTLVLEKTRSNACWTRLPDSELRHHLEAGEASRRSVPGNQPKSIAADPTTVVINSSPSTNCISRMHSACQDDLYSINTYILPCQPVSIKYPVTVITTLCCKYSDAVLIYLAPSLEVLLSEFIF